MAGPSGQTPILHLPYPIDDDSVDAVRDVKALAEALDPIAGKVPIGALMMWMTNTAPTDWLLCQGQTNISAAAYPDLAAVLGSSGGFVTMPNLQGRFPLGYGTSPSHPLRQTGGAEAVQLTSAQSGLMDHHHHIEPANFGGAAPAVIWSGSKYYIRGDDADGFAGVGGLGKKPTSGFSWGYGVGGVAGGAQTAPQAHENMPPFFVVNFIVRAK